MYGSGVMQGCIYVATKSFTILDNARGVGPKGRGSEVRVTYMDVRERRSHIKDSPE